MKEKLLPKQFKDWIRILLLSDEYKSFACDLSDIQKIKCRTLNSIISKNVLMVKEKKKTKEHSG